MSYFYLQVDRLDGQSIGAFFYPLGCKDGMALTERVAQRLDFYREKGFRIIHFSHRPGYKQATRADGVKLELIIIKRKTPMVINGNVDLEDSDGDHATAH